jgi:polyhydroxyalkanoate synthesis regulator phasin
MPAAKSSSSRARKRRRAKEKSKAAAAATSEGLASAAEQLVNRVIKPLGLVVLTRERIQETLDEAAERGRITRSDANDLVAELLRRGSEQTNDIFGNVESLIERARKTVGVGPSFPIQDYDELTAGQVGKQLDGLSPADLRKVREYELRHANRKSVLAAVDKALG